MTPRERQRLARELTARLRAEIEALVRLRPGLLAAEDQADRSAIAQAIGRPLDFTL